MKTLSKLFLFAMTGALLLSCASTSKSYPEVSEKDKKQKEVKRNEWQDHIIDLATIRR